MKELRPAKVQSAIDALLTQPADCSSELRQAIEDYAAHRSLGPCAADGIPENLVAYIDKVILHAFKVSDQDVAQLIAKGYSEDALFEITLCASTGAANARLDAGLMALNQSFDSADPKREL